MRLTGFLVVLSVLAQAGFAQEKTLQVAADGSGEFKTIPQAVAAVPEGNPSEVTIHIKAGTYAGPLVVPKNKPHITLMGDGAEQTLLTWDRNVHDPKPAGNEDFSQGVMVQADDFQAYNLTMENTSGDHGQALALRVDGDRAIFYGCRLVGWQDTLMINNGRDYFQDCYIAGRVDFIFGSATAWFEHCEIHSRNGGHITAASTPKEHPFGFVFSECNLTGDSEAWDPATTNPATTQKARVTPIADLGRPWRPDASVTYLNCTMGEHISPKGWNNWGKTSNESTARYSEYHSKGPGGSAEKRVAWSHQLSDEEAGKITVASVVGGQDHWDPASVVEARGKMEGAATQP